MKNQEKKLEKIQDVQMKLFVIVSEAVDKVVKKIPDAQQVVWVHDEIQVECLEKDAETIGRLAVEAIERTGKHFQLRLPLTGEYKIGDNWSETH